MELLASCSLEESKRFNGTLVLPKEDQKKADKVFLNIMVGATEDIPEVFGKLSGREKCITFPEDNPVSSCPEGYSGRLFNECSLDTLPQMPQVDGVVSLVRLPQGYNDMRTLRKLSETYPNARFMGGNLLGIDGVRIGRFDEGKDKMSPVFEDVYDTFVEVDLNDLEGIQEIIRKVSKRGEGSAPRVAKEKKPPKRAEAFNKLFGGEEEEF